MPSSVAVPGSGAQPDNRGDTGHHDRARLGDRGQLDGVRGRSTRPGAGRRGDLAARHRRRGGGRGAGRVHRAAGPGRGGSGRAAGGDGRGGRHRGAGGRSRPAGPARPAAAPSWPPRARGGGGSPGRGLAGPGPPGCRRRSAEPGQGGPVRGSTTRPARSCWSGRDPLRSTRCRPRRTTRRPAGHPGRAGPGAAPASRVSGWSRPAPGSSGPRPAAPAPSPGRRCPSPRDCRLPR